MRRREESPATNQVLLFGEVLMDGYGYQRAVGGAPFNVARHLQAFGLRPLLISRVGDDWVGDELMAALEAAGLDFEGVQIDPDYPTGSVRERTREDWRIFGSPPDQAYDFIDPEDARQATAGNAPRLIYFGTLAQRGVVSRSALQTILDSVDAPRFVDLNLQVPWLAPWIFEAVLEAADILKLNQDELDVLAWLLQIPGRHRHERAQSLMAKFSIKKLLLTEGADGACLLNADGTQAAVTAPPLADAINTVGVGDAFAAVFILGLLRGWPDPLMLKRADEFARAVCRIREAVPMEDRFYERFLQEWGLV